MTASLGIEQDRVQPGDRVALLGIGSGGNVIMLGLQWQGPSKSPAAEDRAGVKWMIRDFFHPS